MSKYDIDFARWGLLMLPTFWRRQLFMAVVRALMAPFDTLHRQFISARESALYRLDHNGQVCRLRGLLNDLFDPFYRRIEIADSVQTTEVVVAYARDDERAWVVPARFDGRVLVSSRGYAGVGGVDFAVCIPAAIEGGIDLSRLRAVVSTYKLASKRFEIIYI